MELAKNNKMEEEIKNRLECSAWDLRIAEGVLRMYDWRAKKRRKISLTISSIAAIAAIFLFVFSFFAVYQSKSESLNNFVYSQIDGTFNQVFDKRLTSENREKEYLYNENYSLNEIDLIIEEAFFARLDF